MMDWLDRRKGRLATLEFVSKVLERSGYLTELAADDTLESKMRAENLKELVNSVVDYEKTAENPTLEGYLDQVSLVADVDKLEDKKNCVTLMTLHNAKGLEFPIVFITGMEEGLFPHNNSIEEDNGVAGGAPPLLRGYDPGHGRPLSHGRGLPHRLRHPPMAGALKVPLRDPQGDDPGEGQGGLHRGHPGRALRGGGRQQGQGF